MKRDSLADQHHLEESNQVMALVANDYMNPPSSPR